MKTEVNSATKLTDRELARIQTFVDSFASLTSILECDNQRGSLSHEKVIIAVKTAVQLIGNTNAQISCLRSFFAKSVRGLESKTMERRKLQLQER